MKKLKKSRNLEVKIAPRKKQEMRSETHVSDSLFDILGFIGVNRRENLTQTRGSIIELLITLTASQVNRVSKNLVNKKLIYFFEILTI